MGPSNTFFFGKCFINWVSKTLGYELAINGFKKHNIGSPNTFCLENALKKLLNIFSNFFFYLKVQYFRLIMENNFMPMAASAGHAVAYTIGSIFKHINDCVQLYFTNGFTNIVL